MIHNFANFISENHFIITIGISVAALGFTGWQYFDKKAIDSSQRNSKITMRIGALRDTDIIFKQFDNKIVYRQKYKCVISNEGSVDEGIIHWDIYRLDEQAHGGKKKIIYVAFDIGMNPKLIDENNQDIFFPLSISARENKVIYIEVGMIVPTEAWQTVNSEIRLNESTAWQQARYIFSKAGYPGFGQLSPVETSKDDAVIAYEMGDLYQNFLICFIKTNDYQVTGKFNLDINDLYKQGEI